MPAPIERNELPPTAGLPLCSTDLLPGGRASLPAALAPLTGHADAIVTCSGTAALVVALTALARDSGRREVVVPAYTCPLVAIAVAQCGLRVRVCDSRTGHFEMDPRSLRELVGGHTLAVVPAHLGGRLADIEGINAVAHAAGALVIEDAAQALGARHADGTPAGSVGDIGVFSLAAGKGLSIYEGGLLVTRDAARWPMLRDAAQQMLPTRHGWEWLRCLQLLGYWAFYRPRGLGLVYGRALRAALRRGDPVGAVGDRFGLRIPMHRVGAWRQRVGARAAQRLPAFLQHTRELASDRSARLHAIPGLHILSDTDAAIGTWPFLWLLLPDAGRRDAALEQLWCAGLGVSCLFVHALPDYDYLHPIVAPADMPHARDLAARSLTIGNSAWLDTPAFERILAVLSAVCATHPGAAGDPAGID